MKIQLDQQTERLTERIIGAALEVSNVLGHVFLETVYRKALKHGIRDRGPVVAEEVPFEVCYKGIPVGTYFADIIVEASVIVEVESRR